MENKDGHILIYCLSQLCWDYFFYKYFSEIIFWYVMYDIYFIFSKTKTEINRSYNQSVKKKFQIKCWIYLFGKKNCPYFASAFEREGRQQKG